MLPARLLLDAAIISIFEIAGQIFIKTFYEQDERKLYFFFLGWFMYLGVVYFLFKSYSSGNFAVVNSVWNSLTTVTVAVIGWFYYKEKLTKAEMIGIGFVVLGFIIIGAFSDGGQRSKESLDNND